MSIKCLQVLLGLYKHRKTPPYELWAGLRAVAAGCGHCLSYTVLAAQVQSLAQMHSLWRLVFPIFLQLFALHFERLVH